MEGQIIEHVWILEIILDDFFCKKKIEKLTRLRDCGRFRQLDKKELRRFAR